MSFALQVFVSSACYELRDLRAMIREWLLDLGMTPVMSDEGGFPHADGIPPYATCLTALEECQLVIGIIDRYYGFKFDEWGPYPQFAGHGPTHAELKHALDKGKRLLLFIHNDTKNFYELWRKNKNASPALELPRGLQVETLELIEELRKRKPGTWIENFSDAIELKKFLNKEFINQLYISLKETEKQTVDLASHLLSKITESAPEVRAKIEAGLNPSLVLERDELQKKLQIIESNTNDTDVSRERLRELEAEKSEVQAKYDTVSEQLGKTSLLLAQAAMKDAPWIDFVRRTLAPAQPGRLPIHTSADVALRGYYVGGHRQVPVLNEVTWARLPYNESGLHRGYKAGILFQGSSFSPGVTFAHRRQGDTNSALFWQLPNIYFGNYLEASSIDDEFESPLGWRNFEWQVRNPEGHTSEWVLFSYPFDDVKLTEMMKDSAKLGRDLLAEGKTFDAIEPLRKAQVFADRMLGPADMLTVEYKESWRNAITKYQLSQLRFEEGQEVVVFRGEEKGAAGKIDELLIVSTSYAITTSDGRKIYIRDEDVEKKTN